MPNNRAKQLVKEKENKKKAAKPALQTRETADEYLADGVDYEEAGEKWRAGDAAKSTRFFIRALETYDEALKKFPDSFDLAYNKARVQYELTQHPRLLAQLPATLLDLLKTALESTRYALSLNQDNADVLFNTAQVLTSLVEALSAEKSGIVPKEDQLRLLEEAIELFQRCLTLQEFHFAESQAQEAAAASELAATSTSQSQLPTYSGIVPSDTPSDISGNSKFQTSQEEQWATIVEPVTNDTLLDTVLAQLETLTTLCGMITNDEGRGLAWIEEYANDIIKHKLPIYMPGTDRGDEAELTRANFIASLAESNFRSGRFDLPTYERAIEDAFSPLNLANDPEGLCDYAEALAAFNYALSHTSFNASVPDAAQAVASSRWKALTSALDSLAVASKLPSAENLAKIHLMRGDVELLRFQLGQPSDPSPFAVARKNGAVLLKNAQTYFRGAENHALLAQLETEAREAVIKQALAAALGGSIEKLQELLKSDTHASQAILEEAVEDGLVTMESLRGL